MDIQVLLQKIKQDAQEMVWWKVEQIERGEHLIPNTTKGERPWIIPETTGKFLHDLIIKNNFKSVLELGTSIGYSTLWIADAVSKVETSATNLDSGLDSENSGHVHTIEHSKNKIPVAKNYFQESGIGEKITLHEGNILETLETFPTDLKFDFVFMDADRGHYHEYFPLIKKHLLPGALIVADNAGNMSDRMQPFFNLLEQEKVPYEILPIDNGILMIQI